jgi:hypothetical protein
MFCSSRETVWGVLTGQACECTSHLVGHEVREIETWILRLLSAPVSIPGKTKILVTTKKFNSCFFHFYSSDRNIAKRTTHVICIT